LSRGALLTGTVGGIIGTITAAIGMICIFILNSLLTEINDYLARLSLYLASQFGPLFEPWPQLYGLPIPYPIPFFPSTSLFGVSSFTSAIFLIVTGILIGIGFYGTYKIGGGAIGVVSLVFSIIGITSGALFIIMGNLTTGYTAPYITIGEYSYPNLPVPTQNFSVIWIGFVILGVTFLLLGYASISVREMTEKPSASYAAGILSIIGAIVFITSWLIWPIIVIIGFGLIFVAFILWTVIFYSSRNI